MGDPSLSLYTALNTKHPDYVAWEAHWQLVADMLGDNPDPDKRNYLPKSEAENESLYRFRLSLSEIIPECPLTVQKILGALYKQKPTRDIKTDKTLKTLMADADGKGTSWDDYMRRVAKNAIGYGAYRLLVNTSNLPTESSTDTDPVQDLTLAEERAKNIRPFVVNYSPLSVIDWDTDFFGKLSFVRIKEVRYASVRTNETRKHAKITRFIEYDAETSRWWEFRDIDGRIELNSTPGESTHGLGIVPMIMDAFPEPVSPLIGSGLLRNAVKADRRKIRAESDLHYDMYIHAHPMIKARVQDDMASIGIGTNTFLKLNPSLNEDISYVDLPITAAEWHLRVIDMNQHAIQRHAGTDPMGVYQPGTATFQASGESKAWSYETSEARVLTTIADKMESIERSALRLALMYVSKDKVDPEDFETMITYPDEFDMGAVSALLSNIERSSPLMNSKTLMHVLLKRLAAQLAGEIPLEKMKQIIKEIESSPMPGTLMDIGRSENAFNRPKMDPQVMDMMGDNSRGGGGMPSFEKQKKPATVRSGR